MKRFLLPACAAAALAVLFAADPAATPVYPPCPFRLCTGMSCPGCGATRAVHALLHLRFEEAWKLNPLWTAAAPLLALRAAWRMLTGRKGRTGS
ncbi:MAG: DUF2752 domain-containing protein [Bryobacteraceae bacterium]